MRFLSLHYKEIRANIKNKVGKTTLSLDMRTGGERADMEKDKLYVQMLGECSITLGDIQIDDGTKRSSKVWLLLAYLICNRDRIVPQEELIERLWGSEKNDNPGGALKTTLWRTRLLLEPFGPSAGHELIIRRGSGYGWNPDVPTEVDAEQFEKLCRVGAAAADKDVKREDFRKALALYQGDFLEKFSSEAWVEPITAYYYNLYINTVLEMLSLLQTGACAQETVDLCRAVLRTAPYHERFYQYLMRGLMEMQEFKKAAEVYEEMRELLFTNLGIMPNEESQAIYAEILRHVSNHFLTADMIREQLQEKDPPPGALFCDYSFFKLFYQAEARSASRRGDAVHVGLLSVAGAEEKELSERSLERAMEQLRAEIQAGLRRGDVVSRCSASQFVLMLLQANYENSHKVCERIARAFAQAHPRSSARIHCTVLPLEPLQAYPAHREMPLPEEKRTWSNFC